MKKNLLKTFALGVALFGFSQAKAQIKLWGMTNSGTASDNGGIFNYSPNTGLTNVEYSFKNYFDGAYPQNDKVCEINGKIYGTTNSGGENGEGAFYEYDLATSVYTLIKSFNSDIGNYPQGGVMKASNGKVYGCTNGGGNNSYGTLFEYDPTTGVYLTKYHFEYWGGFNFTGRLVEYNNELYGGTQYGADSYQGTLFKYNLSTGVYTVLKTFGNSSTTGSYAKNLTLASNNKFYGCTANGGSNSQGVIFELDPTGASSYTVLYHFNNGTTPGSYPRPYLLQASNGKLVGLTESGGASSSGVVFSFDIALSSYTVLHNFSYSTGSNAQGELVEPATGKLLGLTRYGGSNGNGVLFELDFNTTSYTVKHNFGWPNLYEPYSSLYLAGNGKYYATTQYTSGGEGGLFEFDYATNTFASKFKFKQKLEGAYAYGSLTKLSNGKYYGMTPDGGNNDDGVIFEFDPVTKTQTVKHHFQQATGNTPYGSLMQANNGLLYGYTYDGGDNGDGVLFEYNPTTTSYTVIHHFEYSTGYEPYYGKLVQTSNGLLYGTTIYGGDNGDGTIFQYDIATSSYTVAHHIDNGTNNEGYQPYSGVTIGSNGNLYGTTYEGGLDGYGVIFEFNPTTTSYTVLHHFDNIEGSYPYAGVTEAENGKFFGVTYDGGLNGKGVVFEYDLSLSSYTVKHNFDNANGYNAYGNLYKAADGMLYGMTEYGGFDGSGVLYQYNPTTGEYSKKISFYGENGYYGYGSLIETCETPAPQSIATQTICDDATVADLFAAGSNIKWYNSTGSILAPSTTLVNGDKYYASQTVGCESASKFEVTYTCTVGMEEAANTTFGVYPNPNNGEFTIVSENTNTTFTISDIAGKLVKTGTISANKTEVNLNEVNTGIYFLKVDNQVSKIVKQ